MKTEHYCAVPKFERLEDVVKAIEQENLKIDELLGQLKQKKLDHEHKKMIICIQIPEHYDQVERLIDANQHLVTESDRIIESDFRALMTEQRDQFRKHSWCKK